MSICEKGCTYCPFADKTVAKLDLDRNEKVVTLDTSSRPVELWSNDLMAYVAKVHIHKIILGRFSYKCTKSSVSGRKTSSDFKLEWKDAWETGK